MITDMAQEMASLVEIKRRLAAIEQGQGVLCERLDAITKDNGTANYNKLSENSTRWLEWAARLEKKLDCLQGKELLAQFKAKPKRRRK